MFVAKIRTTHKSAKPNCLCSFLPPLIPRDRLSGARVCQEHLVHVCDADLSDPTPTPTPVHWVTKGCAEKNLCEFLRTRFSFPWRTITNFRVVEGLQSSATCDLTYVLIRKQNTETQP